MWFLLVDEVKMWEVEMASAGFFVSPPLLLPGLLANGRFETAFRRFN